MSPGTPSKHLMYTIRLFTIHSDLYEFNCVVTIFFFILATYPECKSLVTLVKWLTQTGRDLHSIGVWPQFSSPSSALWNSSRVCGCQAVCGLFSCAQLWAYSGSDERSSVRTHNQIQRNNTNTGWWCCLDPQTLMLWYR